MALKKSTISGWPMPNENINGRLPDPYRFFREEEYVAMPKRSHGSGAEPQNTDGETGRLTYDDLVPYLSAVGTGVGLAADAYNTANSYTQNTFEAEPVKVPTSQYGLGRLSREPMVSGRSREDFGYMGLFCNGGRMGHKYGHGGYWPDTLGAITAGAAAGSMIAPGVGTLIGGVLGGVSSIIGNEVRNMNAEREAELYNVQRMQQEANKAYALGLGAKQIGHDRVGYAQRNYVYADGGGLRSVMDAGNGVTMVEEGGSHERNMNGGVPMGMAPDGLPNLVEEGEVKWDKENYIFSNRLKPTQRLLKDHVLDEKKYQGMTYADIAKKIQKVSEERENDPVARDTVDELLGRLMDAQEVTRAEKYIKEMQKAIAQMRPEEVASLMQMQAIPAIQGAVPPAMPAAAPAEAQQTPSVDPYAMGIEQVPAMEQQGMTQSPRMAMGGHLFATGGKPDIPPGMETWLLNRGFTQDEIKLLKDLNASRSFTSSGNIADTSLIAQAINENSKYDSALVKYVSELRGAERAMRSAEKSGSKTRFNEARNLYKNLLDNAPDEIAEYIESRGYAYDPDDSDTNWIRDFQDRIDYTASARTNGFVRQPNLDRLTYNPNIYDAIGMGAIVPQGYVPRTFEQNVPVDAYPMETITPQVVNQPVSTPQQNVAKNTERDAINNAIVNYYISNYEKGLQDRDDILDFFSKKSDDEVIEFAKKHNISIPSLGNNDLTFDFTHGGWGSEDGAAWNGSTDAAWIEALELAAKDGIDLRTQGMPKVAEYLQKTNAYNYGTDWLNKSDENRRRYLAAIVQSKDAPKAAKNFAKRFVNDKGEWLEGAKKDYQSIFGKVRATHPGTYWKTPNEVIAEMTQPAAPAVPQAPAPAAPVLQNPATGIRYYIRNGQNYDLIGNPDQYNTWVMSHANYTLPNQFRKMNENGVDYTDYYVETERPMTPFPRYRPWPGIVNAGIGLMSGFNAPDYEKANIIDSYRAEPVDFKPIGDYLPYDPMDENYMANVSRSQAAATRAALRNGISPSTGAALLGADYTATLGLGNNFETVRNNNQGMMGKVAEFNRGTDQYNASAENAAENTNFGLNGLRWDQVKAYADARDAATTLASQANSAAISSAMGNLNEAYKDWYNTNALGWLVDQNIYHGVGLEGLGLGRRKNKR